MKRHIETIRPEEIEKRSFELIEAELKTSPAEELKPPLPGLAEKYFVLWQMRM